MNPVVQIVCLLLGLALWDVCKYAVKRARRKRAQPVTHHGGYASAPYSGKPMPKVDGQPGPGSVIRPVAAIDPLRTRR